MCRIVWQFCLVAVFVSASGCGSGSNTDAPPSTEVKGTVTLDGNPLTEGEITFEVVGQAHSVLPIKDGAFAGMAYEGKNTVAVRAFKTGPPLDTDPSGPPTKINFLPARYNDETDFTADVTSSGPNEFKFAVTSK